MYVNSCQGNPPPPHHHLRIVSDHHPTSAIMYINGGSCYDGEAQHACDHLNHDKDKPSVTQLPDSGALLPLNTIKTDIFINVDERCLEQNTLLLLIYAKIVMLFKLARLNFI